MTPQEELADLERDVKDAKQELVTAKKQVSDAIKWEVVCRKMVEKYSKQLEDFKLVNNLE